VTVTGSCDNAAANLHRDNIQSRRQASFTMTCAQVTQLFTVGDPTTVTTLENLLLDTCNRQLGVAFVFTAADVSGLTISSCQ
jgi:hypothetical protein